MKAFYNENEPYAVEWLKNLSEAGHIAPGTIGNAIVPQQAALFIRAVMPLIGPP